MQPMTDCAQEFLALERSLLERYPAEIKAARDLAKQVVDPTVSDTDAVWSVLWNKPLFANARVSVAKGWCDKLKPHMAAAWRQWGSRPDYFQITKIGKGVRRLSFEISGEAAEEIDATGIALHRLYAIQGAAKATHKRNHRSDIPYRELADIAIDDAVHFLRQEFGTGWGQITVLHFLTDLGLAVKPDLHLVRTMRALLRSELSIQNRVPSFHEAIEVNIAVKGLMKDLGRPRTSANIRYMDKILMEISRQGVIDCDEETA